MTTRGRAGGANPYRGKSREEISDLLIETMRELLAKQWGRSPARLTRAEIIHARRMLSAYDLAIPLQEGRNPPPPPPPRREPPDPQVEIMRQLQGLREDIAAHRKFMEQDL